MKGYISSKFISNIKMYPNNYYPHNVEIICTYATHINLNIIFCFRRSHFFQISGNVKGSI